MAGLCYWILLARKDQSLASHAQGIPARPRDKVAEAQSPSTLQSNGSSFDEDAWISVFNAATLVPKHSVTAVLPVNAASLPLLRECLLDLFRSRSALKETILLTPAGLILETRKVVLELTSTSHARSYPELSIHCIWNGSSEVYDMLDAISDASTDWILVLDEHGLRGLDSQTKDLLLNPKAVPLPFGPKGRALHAGNLTYLGLSLASRPAAFLSPPMVVSASVLGPEVSIITPSVRTWEALGELISRSQLDSFGGFLVGHADSAFSDALLEPTAQVDLSKAAGDMGHFLVILDTRADLLSFSSALCRLQEESHLVKVLLSQGLDPSSDGLGGGAQSILSCDITVDVLSERVSEESVQLSKMLLSFRPLIIINSSDDIRLAGELRVVLRRNIALQEATVIRLFKDDLPFSDWMGALSLQEWKRSPDWNVPRIDINVITNDRPASLARLLRSLQRARYYGDSLDLRVNMDSSADDETKALVSHYHWPHGKTFVHHRIIHGGLLPAVVESWYPVHNDSYGLILEDDVELSPLFYAWAKMAILRYSGDIDTSRLFGVSLYQQKTIELKPEGRRPFNARSLFLREGLQHTDTPYLSQIPCSWGAVYFPEHWREFHDYLSFRLSELRLSISDDVIPTLRSNHWTKSWKKYFIELSYLRGYVMLYPNYDNFTSLSTNHLEIGSHVKDTPKELYEQKKRLFNLPLLLLPDSDNPAVSTGILELPGRALPLWSKLPVLDHQGSVTSLDGIVEKGSIQRSRIFHCSQPPLTLYDARDLTCIATP
ncbi:hypothetical protein OE88DRAFT_1628550 [Heliocybe sulcata]|uniref:Uncharacterized protein n=1 Tax=Heliocybe sulcata TaxID=5364 RepID=A0A5C3N1T5_9AGAM|nr:hypothetical protein OE88DRAFT_1628550 [Heliocybe sulcata]